MIGKIFKRKPEEKAILALDLGTENIKAHLFTVEEKQSMSGEVIGKRGIIKGVGRVSHRTLEKQGSGITDIASVVLHAKEAIRIASHQAGLQPTQMVLGVAGEFVKGATSKMSYEREEPETKINVSELKNIIHKLQWRAFGEVRRAMSDETGYPEIDIKLVSSSIVDVRVDGYKVTNLLGFQGKKVEMSIFNCFAPLGHYAALQSIADEIGLELLGIVSEPFAISKCLEFESTTYSAIFIDVGGSGTDVAIVSNGSVMGTKMFGIGGRTFTKRISVELNISPKEAEQLKYAYTFDKLEQKSKKIISNIIDEDIEDWLEGVVLAISEFSQLEVLPSKILLSGGGTYLPEIKSTLNERKWHKKLNFQTKPIATFLTPKDLRNIIDESKKVGDREDITPLALVNIGIELAAEDSIVQKLLKKVIGIMKV